MRTQRLNYNKSTRMQTTQGSLNGDDNSPPQISSKKFIRKGDLPLTTGRKNVQKLGLICPDIETSKVDSE